MGISNIGGGDGVADGANEFLRLWTCLPLVSEQGRNQGMGWSNQKRMTNRSTPLSLGDSFEVEKKRQVSNKPTSAETI